MKVPLLDLKIQYESLREEIVKATEEVYASQHFILGPKVEELERLIAGYCGCEFAVGVSSGTDALLISLMAANIGEGDLVITSPYTFFATGGSIARVGARPVFVDIDPNTYNMDARSLEAVISRMTKEEKARLRAVMPVHLYGQCADMEDVLELARMNRLVVIEDAAQAIGAEYERRDGTVCRAGIMGEYGCFSFFPSKNLGGFGDGGMVTTPSREIFRKLKILRVHGSDPKYYHKVIGGNFRLDALQAAILSVKFRHLEDWTAKRNANAATYRRLFEDRRLDGIFLPMEKEKRHVYNQFVIRVREDRDALRRFLAERGVGTEVYYPVPLHLQECFRYLGYREGDLPASEEAAKKTIALPIYPELGGEQINYVVDCIGEFVSK